MSTTPEPQVDLNLLEQTRRHINRLVQEIANLSTMELSPAEYYAEFLQRVLSAVKAPAGAIWLRTPQGHLHQQYQVNMRQVGLDRTESDRQMHDELLRTAAQVGRPQLVPPHSSNGAAEDGKTMPGNPTDFVIMLAPILVDKQVAGLIEVIQQAEHNPAAQHGFLQFVGGMAEHASSYTRNHQLRTMTGQQALWTQLEVFARQVHNSLNPTEVSYQVANEGRRLIECDRLTVAQRLGRKAKVEAVSGSDVVEKRSNLVRLMAALFTSVLLWGEKLVYRGVHDDTLPPGVLDALDAYLAESNSKLLVVLPLQDDREEESTKPRRSALMMECFDPAATPDQLVARLDVIGRHSASALYNAAEHKRIPMRFIWGPLAKLQDGLGGKTRAIITGVAALVVMLVLAMIFVPYPLKMEGKGQLLPKDRRYIYSPISAQIKEFLVEPNQTVRKDDPLIRMYDETLGMKLATLDGEVQASSRKKDWLQAQFNMARNEGEKKNYRMQADTEQITLSAKESQLRAYKEQNNVDPQTFGQFIVKSPINGTILSSTFKEDLTGRFAKPDQPILRVGKKSGEWEIEMKIPEKHIGQVLRAYGDDPDKTLDVDLILRSAPTKTYRGKLSRQDIGGEAQPNRDENNETDPSVTAWVRIEGDDIAPDYRLPHNDEVLVAGTEVLAKVRCGSHAMGYSLFYGVWEFIYEKIVFFF